MPVTASVRTWPRILPSVDQVSARYLDDTLQSTGANHGQITNPPRVALVVELADIQA